MKYNYFFLVLLCMSMTTLTMFQASRRLVQHLAYSAFPQNSFLQYAKAMTHEKTPKDSEINKKIEDAESIAKKRTERKNFLMRDRKFLSRMCLINAGAVILIVTVGPSPIAALCPLAGAVYIIDAQAETDRELNDIRFDELNESIKKLLESKNTNKENILLQKEDKIQKSEK